MAARTHPTPKTSTSPPRIHTTVQAVTPAYGVSALKTQPFQTSLSGEPEMLINGPDGKFPVHSRSGEQCA